MDTKSLGRVDIKDGDRGEITAVFATLGVIDSDGDVTVTGAFEDGAPVRISAYGHKSWDGALPVGRGVIKTVGDEAILDGRFFIDDMPEARSTFAAVKGLAELQEWSYGYDPTEFSFGEQGGQRVRFLNRLKVHEISPVLLGAGVGTRTLTAKSAKAVGGADQHTTPVVADLWNGYETTKGIPEGARPADLRTMYAWVTPDGAKTGYAHHHGLGGAANIRACLAGIATLNSAKPDIPDADREAVYDHLAAHLRDAGREVPKLRAADSGEVKFHDELLEGLAGLSGLVDNASRVVALRADKGKDLSGVNAEILGWITDDLTRLKGLLPTLPATEVDETRLDPSLFLASVARIHGL